MERRAGKRMKRKPGRIAAKKHAKTKALVPQVVSAEDRSEQQSLVDEATKRVPQLFNEAQRRLVLNETPRYLIKKRKGKAGLYFDYVDVNYVVEQLNYIFGFRWSFKPFSPSAGEMVAYLKASIEIGQFIVIGELIVPDPKRKGETISKVQTGRAEIKMLQDKSKPLDTGNDLKAAWSDCLKKCASWFGVALDVYSGSVTRRQDSSHPEHAITEGQRRRLEVLANEAGIGHSGLKRLIADLFDYTSSTDIRRKHFEDIQTRLQDKAAKREIEELNIPDDIQQGFDILETPPAKRIATFKAYASKGEDGLKELRAKMSAEVDKRTAGQKQGAATKADLD